ncbi:hypothetical protein PCASD_17340 [Puccinia coronata f. sp. avenae]|uniref:Uncharacterized protein n=1 Tax=Puccinia coronata f. sp. avenae TaxID=200324 RepID=A0A2N5U6N0_9BASI|nr:hypothetical protein PCASD_17340 [Puccinia coronata f. sp. avenae]
MAEFWAKPMDELQKIAQIKSKRVMTKDDETFLLQLRKIHQREMVLAAIQRQVSMGMVEELMGKKQSQRGLTSWNQFQIEKKSVFKGQAVHSGVGMSNLSAMWQALRPDERIKYRTDNLTLTAEEEPATPDLMAVSGLRAQPQSLIQSAKRVSAWLDMWQKKAVYVAKTNHCEIVTFAVSNHLGDHNFQSVRATPGAASFVQQINEVDGLQNYESRLQAFITGANINQIPAAVKKKQDKGSAPLLVAETRSRLAALVSRDTNNQKTSWSWSQCDVELGRLGYKVVFMPEAISLPEWIKSPSSGLTKTEAELILEDLNHNYIRVVRDRDALLGTTRVIPPKAPRNRSASRTDDTCDDPSSLETERTQQSPAGQPNRLLHPKRATKTARKSRSAVMKNPPASAERRCHPSPTIGTSMAADVPPPSKRRRLLTTSTTTEHHGSPQSGAPAKPQRAPIPNRPLHENTLPGSHDNDALNPSGSGSPAPSPSDSNSDDDSDSSLGSDDESN